MALPNTCVMRYRMPLISALQGHRLKAPITANQCL
jgi:hypothetical protein